MEASERMSEAAGSAAAVVSKRQTVTDANDENPIEMRDRTAEFAALRQRHCSSPQRQQQQQQQQQQQVVIGSHASNNVESYRRTLQDFLELQATIEAKIQRLSESQRAYLRPSFDDDDDDARRRAAVEKQSADAQALCRELERLVLHGIKYRPPTQQQQQQQQPSSQLGVNGASAAAVGNFYDLSYDDEELIARNVRRRLSASLAGTLRRLRATQEWYAGELRRREAKAKRFTRVDGKGVSAATRGKAARAGGTSPPPPPLTATATPPPPPATQGSSPSPPPAAAAEEEDIYEVLDREERTARFLRLGYAEADIPTLLLEEARQRQTSEEILEILQNLQEIQTMFQDLEEMVVEQGTVLDRVDYNVEQAQVNTAKGLAELKKAQEYQNTSTCVVM